MIETKEGVALSEQTQTLARITYQRFFRRYLRLAGMTGTAREMARRAGGRLPAAHRDHPHAPAQRAPARRRPGAGRRGRQVAGGGRQAWRALHARGQPVLVGTRSVDASERLSAAAARARPAAPGAQRAAGRRRGRHRGRGRRSAAPSPWPPTWPGAAPTSRLGEGVAERGGLHVILTEYHESPRIDRQLFGRARARATPAAAQAIVALDDELFRQHGGTEHSAAAQGLRRPAAGGAAVGGALPPRRAGAGRSACTHARAATRCARTATSTN